MPHDLLTRLVAEIGLDAYADRLAAAAADAIRLMPEPAEEHRLPLGASRLGGVPDLGPSQEWPHWSNGPQSFIAQLALTDLRTFPVAAVFPTEGWLSFFYNAQQDTWGFDPKDQGSFQILYTPPGPLHRVPCPSDLEGQSIYELCAIQFSKDFSLPARDSLAFATAGLSSIPEPELNELEERLAREQQWAGRSILFGHPDQIQNEMQTECALVTGGLYCGDPSGYKDPRAVTLRQMAPSWRLLLQVASEDRASMMWGDAGCLYYWMRHEDMTSQAFDRAWMILQCS